MRWRRRPDVIARSASGEAIRFVIPGWCFSTRPGISRFRVRCFASPRNDVFGLLRHFLATTISELSAFWPRTKTMSAMLLAQQILNGLLDGVYYLLIALGLSLIFSLGGIVNLAHGAFY